MALDLFESLEVSAALSVSGSIWIRFEYPPASRAIEPHYRCTSEGHVIEDHSGHSSGSFDELPTETVCCELDLSLD